MKLTTTCDYCGSHIEINDNVRAGGTVLAFCSDCYNSEPTSEPLDEFSTTAVVGTSVSANSPMLISKGVTPLSEAPRGSKIATLLR